MITRFSQKTETDDSRIEPVSIQQLISRNFFIPSYQRGYRWTTQQVKELLEDIKEFIEKGAKGIYCLQPLVVKRNEEGCCISRG